MSSPHSTTVEVKDNIPTLISMPMKQADRKQVLNPYGYRVGVKHPIAAWSPGLRRGLACELYCKGCGAQLAHHCNSNGTHWLRHPNGEGTDPGTGYSKCEKAYWDALEEDMCRILVKSMRDESDAYDYYNVHEDGNEMLRYAEVSPHYLTDMLAVDRATGEKTFMEIVVTSEMSAEKRRWLRDEFDQPYRVFVFEMHYGIDAINAKAQQGLLTGKALTRIIASHNIKKEAVTAYTLMLDVAYEQNRVLDAEKRRIEAAARIRRLEEQAAATREAERIKEERARDERIAEEKRRLVQAKQDALALIDDLHVAEMQGNLSWGSCAKRLGWSATQKTKHLADDDHDKHFSKKILGACYTIKRDGKKLHYNVASGKCIALYSVLTHATCGWVCGPKNILTMAYASFWAEKWAGERESGVAA